MRTYLDSLIVKELLKKASRRNDTDFDFIGKLKDFRSTVSQEIKNISLLFPEYTPHDEEYHIRKLFFLADTLLGTDVVQKLNTGELFILAVGLFGHDWGMAVSELERECIIQGKPEPKSSTISLIPNEVNLFKDYCKASGIKDGNSIDEIYWREYVRKTHAIRSSCRVKKYFQKYGQGIGDAGGRVCEGHWLNFEELENHTRFPLAYSVLSESINLKAIAIYVRLVDLFDIGDDRTPYILWKYISPKDKVSKLEWEKHRCLSPITINTYQGGRIITVDGSTNDHNVYASILDLKNYCDSQLRKCNDLLAHLSDSKYSLNIFHCEWRIVPNGFVPSQIRFEFDRSKMFEILSHDIYNDDPYVFLRELLQNSIDAINLRKAILEKESIKVDGKVEVDVSTASNGNILIKWKDNGCGMDEYIVKNYLSKAGVSYYRSDDFTKLNIPIDPISKFGVGILSCFMLSEGITIETKREPYITKGEVQPLTINIIQKEKEFRVEKNAYELTDVGTLIKLELNIKKIEKIFEEKIDDFNILKYLTEIASFTAHPLHINYYGESKVIVSSTSKESKDSCLKYNLSIDPKEILEPFCVEDVLKYVSVETIDHKQLGLKNVQGAISIMKFSPSVVKLMNTEHSWPSKKYELIIADGDKKSLKKVVMHIKGDWDNRRARINIIGSSRRQMKYYGVYSNGILLSKAPEPNFATWEKRGYGGDFCYLPKMNFNFTKGKYDQVISISRNEFVKEGNTWDNDIMVKYYT